MKKYSTILAIATLIASIFVQPGEARAAYYNFGDYPYLDVVSAASQARTKYGITDISANELAAIIFAPTWYEAAAETVGAPSPMYLGREDGPWYWAPSSALWAFGNLNTTEKRAFWHAGIGMWQLDSAGVGETHSTVAAIYSYSSANIVADWIAAKWKNSSGTLAARRAYVWTDWDACDSGNCELAFGSIFNTSTQSLQNIIRTTAVTPYGGAEWKSCNSGGGGLFQCLKVDPMKAQGQVSFMQRTPWTGYTNQPPSPLSTVFYTWENGTTSEARLWQKQATGYTSHIYATRPMGYGMDFRTSGTWSYLGGNNICTDLGC